MWGKKSRHQTGRQLSSADWFPVLKGNDTIRRQPFQLLSTLQAPALWTGHTTQAHKLLYRSAPPMGRDCAKKGSLGQDGPFSN